jgi:hypothetical protein
MAAKSSSVTSPPISGRLEPQQPQRVVLRGGELIGQVRGELRVRRGQLRPPDRDGG